MQNHTREQLNVANRLIETIESAVLTKDPDRVPDYRDMESNRTIVLEMAKGVARRLELYHHVLTTFNQASVANELTGYLQQFEEGAVKECERMEGIPRDDERYAGKLRDVRKAFAAKRDEFESRMAHWDLTLRCAEVITECKADQIRKSVMAVQKLKARAVDASDQATKALNDINEMITSGAIERLKTHFSELATCHQLAESRWNIAAAVAFVWLAITAYSIVFGSRLFSEEVTAPEIVPLVLRNTLAIGLPLILLRVSLTRASLERNLQIVYRHRHTAFQVNSMLESGLTDSLKFEFRREIAKAAYSDPTTGYTEQLANNAVSITPIINTMEKGK